MIRVTLGALAPVVLLFLPRPVAAQQLGSWAEKLALDDAANQPGPGRKQRELGGSPLYDQLRDAELKLQGLQEKLAAFEFHGYLRTGFGLNGRGGQQVAFAAPGAGAKYRLGNEAETYGELTLVNNWVNPDKEIDKVWLRTEIMVQADTSNASNDSSTDHFRLRESFVQAGNILRAQPGAVAWAGQRYYRRQQVDINDFFSIDMSGYGAGFEDLDVGIGKLALAVLGGASEAVVGSIGRYTKVNLDARLYDIPVPLGKFGFWLAAARTPPITLADGTKVPAASGVSFAAKHVRPNLLGGYNNLIVAYGRGVAENMRTQVPAPSPFMADAARFVVIEHVLLQPSQHFAVMATVVYQRRTSGDPDEDPSTWLSFGARPVVFFSRHLSWATEAGFDRTVDGQGRYQGWLQKYSTAPQIAAGQEFFSRPVLRLFVTYAQWSPGLVGLIGGAPYAARSRGLAAGVQAEAWW